MKLQAILIVSLWLLAGSNGALADTVQTKNNVICNGTVVILNAEELVFEASVQGTQRVYKIQRSDLKTIEFNTLRANREAPKGPFLMQAPTAEATSAAASAPKTTVIPVSEDTLVRRGGGGTVKGAVVSIDANQVVVSGAAPIPRNMVSVIVFSGK